VAGFDASLPIFVAGISLGGCIALNCIQQQVHSL
jgi:alpha-beta hydrolase superfamily lysophospholipase